MKIKTLISKLQKLDADFEVILSSDAEGNNYSPIGLVYYKDGLKFLDDGYGFQMYEKSDVSNDKQDFPSIDDYNKGENCIVLYPV